MTLSLTVPKMEESTKPDIGTHPRESEMGTSSLRGDRDTLRGHWRLIGAVLAALLATGLAVAAYAQSQDTTMTIAYPKIEDVTPEWTGATFPGVAEIGFMGYCPPANYSTTCYISVSVSFSISSPQPDTSLFAKSVTLELTSTIAAQLAITSGNTLGPTYHVLYGEDASGYEFATVYTPFVSAGSTWTFDFLVINAPTVNGTASLGMTLDVQVGNSAIIGHSYDLQVPIRLSTNSTLG
jgi:hypothetical protein